METTKFNVWKTINLGTFIPFEKSADGIRKAFKKAGFTIGQGADSIFGTPKFAVYLMERQIQLVNVSVADLGFKSGATYKDICAKAKELGLELCPSEVGPQLRLQYKDQSKGEYLRIGMEPISDSFGGLGIFVVEHVELGGGSLRFNSNGGCSDFFWEAYCRFVFCIRK